MDKKAKKPAPASKATSSATVTASVAYDRLALSPALNVRAGDYKPEGIDELAALILAKGLIQPLTVRAGTKGGKHEIVDGGRRYTAIGRLRKSGDWPASRPVPCIIRDEDAAAARETSLVANISREPMHPVRELEVFAELHSGGADVASIAHRYGVSEKLVRQRLALGGLAPEIRHAWKEGRISAETAQAFATCRDVARQIKLFRELSKNHQLQAWAVKQALVKDKPRLDDHRLSFIGGVDAYKAAGGHVVESLFKDDGYLEDGKLLEQLVTARMVAKCEELRDDGWSFAVPVSDVKGQNHWTWQRVRPGKVEYTAAEERRMKELDAEREALEAIDMLTYEQSERIDAIDDEYRTIEHTGESRAYSAAQKKKSGCVVDGADITYGLVRPKPGKDAKGKQTVAAGDDNDNDIDNPDVDPRRERQEDDAGEPRISNSLMMSISEKQTMAAAKALASSPAVALAIVVAGLRSHDSAPVKITSAGFHGAKGAIDDTGYGNFGEVLDDLAGKDLTEELARALSRTLDLRRYAANDHAFGHKCDSAGIAALVAWLPGDTYLAEMRVEFDAGDYFHRSPAAVIRAAIAEMDPRRQVSASAKKKDLVAIATELADPMGWLPEELRHPEYVLLGEGFAQALKGKKPKKGHQKKKAG